MSPRERRILVAVPGSLTFISMIVVLVFVKEEPIDVEIAPL